MEYVENYKVVLEFVREDIYKFARNSGYVEESFLDHYETRESIFASEFSANKTVPDEELHASATLYVDFKQESYKSIEDSEGNFWTKYVVDVKISHPSYGSSSVAFCEFQLKFLSDVTEFARRLEKEFTYPVYKMYMTKAESKKLDLEVKQKLQQKKMYDFIKVLSTRKSMRVGNSKYISVPTDYTDGTYTVEIDNKEYEVVINNKSTDLLSVLTRKK